MGKWDHGWKGAGLGPGTEQLSSAAIGVIMRAVRRARSVSPCPGQSSATSKAWLLLENSWSEVYWCKRKYRALARNPYGKMFKLCVCVHVCVCMCAQTHTLIHTYTCAHNTDLHPCIYMCIYTDIYTCMCIYTYIYTCIYMHTCIHMHSYTHIHIYMYMHAYMCTHTYIIGTAFGKLILALQKREMSKY